MDNRTFVSLPAQQCLLGLLQEALSGQAEQLDVVNRWCTLTLQPAASTVTLTSNPLSSDGEVGVYTGSVTFPYLKRDLGQLLPYPLVYPVEYPTTFVRLATYFQDQYGICLEDGEFTIPGNSITDPLNSTDSIDATPDGVSGTLQLVATSASGRFTAGSVLYVHPTADGVAVPMHLIGSLDSALDFLLLTDHF